MDHYSSGEDLVVKTRKPYTITKQRERWTEDEHNRFLEALKLHGRAWQRIEEHIGTKTAVQIRSHAQKFFTKLEKEASVKGVPVGHALDIEIPPPRPKKKPSNPYPRKISIGSPALLVGLKNDKISNSVSSSCQDKSSLDLEKEPEKLCDDRNLGNTNGYHEKDNCSEVFTFVKTSTCASANKIALPLFIARGNSFTSTEYLPISKEASNHDETTGSRITIVERGLQPNDSDNKQLFQDNGSVNTSNVVNSYFLHEKIVHGKRIDELKPSKSVEPAADVESSLNYPRHVPVQVLDGNLGISAENISEMSNAESVYHQVSELHGHLNLSMNPAASVTSYHHGNASRSSIHPSVSCYQPIFTPVQNQDDYRYFLNTSSMFSNLIISLLLQNPAAHAAALAAASFSTNMWPCVNVKAPEEHPSGTPGAFQSRQQINAAPSMAAIAAATVAAATAWWAAHGLLPSCAPFHPGFTCSPATAFATPTHTSYARGVDTEGIENTPDPASGEQLEPECSEALHEQHSASKSPILSSDSEASEDAKLKSGAAAGEKAQIADAAERHDSKSNRKQVDRSSCGSNTPSSSDVEAHASEKHTKGTDEKCMKDEESKELDAIHPAGDPISRRSRSTSILNDSWKEVSEGGRLAFQALFSREILPQSFSPPHDLKNKGSKNADKATAELKEQDGLQLDLNLKTWNSCSQKQGVDNNDTVVDENRVDGLLNMGLGHANIKSHRTGFKPYKRCLIEAKESRMLVDSQNEEKGPKRLRLGEEAST